MAPPLGFAPRTQALTRPRDTVSPQRNIQRKLVGTGGSAPLVVFRPCFMTTGLQPAGRNSPSQKNSLNQMVAEEGIEPSALGL